MSVIGFDIGNESCVIAAAKRGGIDILLNDEAKRETPSVVLFGDKQRFLGSAGAAFATSNPKSTITQIKRLIGRLYNEPSVQEDLKLLPYVTREGPRGGVLIEIEYLNKTWMFSPVEILGMLFTHLKQIAEKNLESPVVDCVIGVPSYFTDLQRREYLDAARIAGLVPLRLMHDGTAIALGYGMYKTDLLKSGPTVVVFVDIGHCDTQVTVAAFEQGGMRILSHSFDLNLGGRDFDEVLFRHFAAQFKEKYKIDVYSSPRASTRLRASCEKVKKVLSANAEAPISIECLIDDTDVRGVIKREEFEKLSEELLDRVTVPCVMAVEDSGISVDKIYTMELVGSGSRIPAISKVLTSIFNKEPTRTLNASECVARGCALRCAMLSPAVQVRNYQVDDIYPYSIALSANETINNLRQEYMLFPKGSPIPCDRMMTHDGTTEFYFQVSYTNMTDFPPGVSPTVGHFQIGVSEDSGAETLKVEFNMRLNDHGIVEVESASILEAKPSAPRSLGSFLGMIVDNSQPLNLAFSENYNVATTREELHEARAREHMLAEQDKKVEENKDQRNTLESFVYDTRSKLSSAYQTFATDSEKVVITNSLQKTEDWLYEDSDDESEQDYTGKLQDLKKLIDPIEKRYKDEKAKTEITKALVTCIEEYRSVANSMPTIKKKEVNNECIKVEEWLNRVQRHSSTKNADPIEWLNIIKHGMETLEWNCKNIMRPKPSFSKHEKPMHSNQRGRMVDPNQRDRTVDSNHRNQHVKSNRKDQTVYSNHMNQRVDLSQRHQSVDSNHRNQRVDSNHRNQQMNSDYRNSQVDSNHNNQRVEAYQRDWLVVNNQRNQPLVSNHRNQRDDSNQRDQSRISNQTGQSVDLPLRDQHEDSYQRGHIVDSVQKD